MRSRAVEGRVIAQAKINLFLRILAREVDGYHSIETMFLRVDLGDVVRVRVTSKSDRSIDCQGAAYPAAGLGAPEHNLAYRAASAYVEVAGWPNGFSIEIEKLVPVGGGLGGGSADAAAVLRILDALAPDPIGAGPLAQIAARLGADVPFMLSDSVSALAWGRGERLLHLRPPTARDVDLLVPAFGVSTRWAYEQFAASRGEAQPRPIIHRAAQLSSWDHLAAIAINDLEPVVASHHSEISAGIADLRARGARIAMMSGSGSVVFGVFDDAISVNGESPNAGSVETPAAAARLRTRTSSRVVGVERIE
jgi:4-diphosphocytidyl-2-C-methyl-D-erythritol kinase